MGKEKALKEIERISHHKCDKCENEWSENLMIFKEKNNEIRILHKIKKPFVTESKTKSSISIKYSDENEN